MTTTSTLSPPCGGPVEPDRAVGPAPGRPGTNVPAQRVAGPAVRPESEGGQWGEGVSVAAVTTLGILTEVGEARMFRDRIDAGKRLGARLVALRGHDVVVVGLPRGGVPVAAEVARALEAPLDVIVVRKLGVPWQPELAMGAVGEDGVLVVDENTVRQVGVSAEELAAAEERESKEVARRAQLFRGDRHRTDLRGRTVVVVDD